MAPLSTEERFWLYLERGEPDACWPWRHTQSVYGYGVLNRASWRHVQ